MEESSRNKLLDLIPKERSWTARDCGDGGGFGAAEEQQLELRLGPPGEERRWLPAREKREETSSLSLSLFPNPCAGAKRVFLDTVESKPEGLQLGLGKDQSGRAEHQQSIERKACCQPTSHASSAPSGAAAVGNCGCQTRNASVPVVGWPPIRSYRKNMASGSSKPSLGSENVGSESGLKPKSCKGMFVKINMDGIPIGRKVDLKAYHSYEELSSVVEELFQGLLAAQRDPAANGTVDNTEDKQAFTGLLDGSGEYVLVCEDAEGDRMLAGFDVPWDMFVATAKRLRVLKSSDLSALLLGRVSRKRTAC